MMPFDLTSDCARYTPLLPLLPHGGLTAAEALATQEHLAHCQNCQRRYALQHALDQSLKAHYRDLAHGAPTLAPMQTAIPNTPIGVRTMHPSLPQTSMSASPQRRTWLTGITSLVAVAVIVILAFTVFRNHLPGANIGGTTGSGRSVPLPSQTQILSLSMVSPNEGWAAGYSYVEVKGQGQSTPLLVHLKDGKWSSEPFRTGSGELIWVVMVSPQEGWAGANGMMHFTAGKWQVIPPEAYGGGAIRVTQAFSATDVWAQRTDANGTHFSHFDGVRWADQLVTVPPGLSVRKVQFASDHEGWAVATPSDPALQHQAVFIHLHNGVWTVDHTLRDTDIYSLSVTSSGSAWAAGTTSNPDRQLVVWRYAGGHWEEVQSSVFSISVHVENPQFSSDAQNDVWLTSLTIPSGWLIYHFDGSVWQSLPSPLPHEGGLLAFSANPRNANEAWLVGPSQEGVINLSHYVQGTWVSELYQQQETS